MSESHDTGRNTNCIAALGSLEDAVARGGGSSSSHSIRNDTNNVPMEQESTVPGSSAQARSTSPGTSMTPPPPPSSRHTQFLDLTNGTGGSLAQSAHSQSVTGRSSGRTDLSVRQSLQNDPARSYIVQHMRTHTQDDEVAIAAAMTRRNVADDDDPSPLKQRRRNNRKRLPHSSKQGPEEKDRGGLSVSIVASATNAGENADGKPYHASNPNFNPNTPGKVVENGHEHTGRWTQEEHSKFLLALKMYGKEWKKVAAKVKTRTVVQTRTHAQKYFQKLQKAKQSGEEITTVPMGTTAVNLPSDNEAATTATNAPPVGSTPNKRQKINNPAGNSSTQKPSPNASKFTSGAGNATVTSLGIPIVVPNRGGVPATHRQSSVTSAAQLISNLAGSGKMKTATPSTQAEHGDANGQAQSFRLAAPGSAFSSAPATVGSRPTSGSGGHGKSGFGISIVAPDATASLRQNPFPEPSPAACGRRKNDELAAAKLLAGVATTPGGSAGGLFASLAQLPIKTSSGSAALRRTDSASNDMAVDGTATPPPSSSGADESRSEPVYSVEASNATAIPVASSNSVTAGRYAASIDVESGTVQSSSTTPSRDKARPEEASSNPSMKSLSLQIVNPESLGVTYSTTRSKQNGGGESPVTPWEGQLQALVEEEKQKSGDGTVSDENSPDSIRGGQFAEGGMPKMPTVGGALGVETSSTTPGVRSSWGFVHHVVRTPSEIKRSRLHKAVCDMDMAAIQIGLSLNSDHLERKDEYGYAPLHSAAALGLRFHNETGSANVTSSSDICRVLLSAGADSSARDKKGNTPLHWACRAGDSQVAELLLQSGQRDAKNDDGESPLHWAARAGRRGLQAAQVLLANGASPASLNKDFRRPIDVAADGYDDEGLATVSQSTGVVSRPSMNVMELKELAKKRKRLTKEQRGVLRQASVDRKLIRALIFQQSTNSRTLVLHHPECLEHIPKASSDWECPARVTTILDRVVKVKNSKEGSPDGVLPHEICVSQDFDKAKVDLLNRVHSTDYLNFVSRLSADLGSQVKKQRESQHHQQQQHILVRQGENGSDEDSVSGQGTITPPVVPFTPMVQKSMTKIADTSVKLGQHSDTSFSAGSLNAARRAAGAVQHAVDCVLVGRHRNAFCVVRPPGHHAGVNGLLDGGESCGFCIFNNVAAGAMHAISDETLLCERCAIVDIDVHHGNGTEEIVRKYHDPSKLFFFSIHLYDNERKGKRETKSFQYKFYPGTGDEDDIAMNIINVPIAPLWKEPSSTPATRSSHNTRQKSRLRSNEVIGEGDGDDNSSDAGTPRTSDVESVANDGRPQRSATNSPVPSGGSNMSSGRLAYRNAIQSRLLPALRAFNPDLILISAGFDAAKDDVGNAKHEANRERRGMDLEPEDYAWTTRKVLEVADICCQGRVVSVLEGGYGKTPQRQQGPLLAKDSENALDKSYLGECALRHLHAMVDPYDVERRFPSSV